MPAAVPPFSMVLVYAHSMFVFVFPLYCALVRAAKLIDWVTTVFSEEAVVVDAEEEGVGVGAEDELAAVPVEVLVEVLVEAPVEVPFEALVAEPSDDDPAASDDDPAAPLELELLELLPDPS